MILYLIEQHHHDISGWYTDTYAIFDDFNKLLEHIRTKIDNDHLSDWLNYDWFYSVYKINDPLLKDKIKIDYLEELYKRYPEVADLVRYRERKERESWDNLGMVGTLTLNMAISDYVSKKVKGS